MFIVIADVQPSVAVESVAAIKSEPDEMLLDDNTLMALLNECLNTSNIELQCLYIFSHDQS